MNLENYYKLLAEYTKLFKYFKDNASWRDDTDIENIQTVDELINHYDKELKEAFEAEEQYYKTSLEQIEKDEIREIEKDKFCKCIMCDYCKNNVPF